MNKQHFLFRGALAAAALGMTLPAGAAEEEAKKKEESNVETAAKVLDKVMVIGNPANIEELPGSAYVVTKQDIREQNYDDVSQALRKVPGVTVRSEFGYGLFPSISLRGVDTTRSAKVTIMEDGVLTAPAPYSAPAAYYSPTMGRMSGLEILKGSSQVKYGPQTTGGVVNYLSTPIPLEENVYLKTTVGSFGDLRTHAYGGNTVDTDAGQFGFLVESYYRKSDGFKTIGATSDTLGGDGNTGFTKSEPMVKLSWEPKSDMYQRIEFKYGSSTLDANETYLGLSEADFAADPFSRYAATRFDNITSKQTRSYLRYAAAPSDDIDVIATLYSNTFARNWYKLGDIRDVNGSGTIKLGPALAGVQNGEALDCLRGDLACTLRVKANNRTYKTEGVDVNGYFRFGNDAVQHEIAAGVRVNNDQIIRFQWRDSYEQDANGNIIGITAGAAGGAGDRLQKTTATAVYVQDNIKAGAWGFTPGVRFEQVDQTYINNYAAGTSPTLTNTLNMFAGSLGATYKFDDQWIGFASVNRGFSPPSPKSATGGQTEETSTAYELGARYTNENKALAVEAVAFHTQFRNLIVVDNIGGAGSGEDGNFGEVNSTGLELAVQYDAGIANKWGYGNPWYLTATYTDATQQNDAVSTDAESIFSYGSAGKKVPYISDLVLSMGTGIESKNWGTAITATYVSAAFASANNVDNQLNGEGNPDARFGKTDAYFVADVSAFYRVSEGVKFFGGVQNLTDNVYIVSRQPYGARPGMPMYVYAGIEMDL